MSKTGECMENFRCSEVFRESYRARAAETDKSRSEYIRDALDFYEAVYCWPEDKIQETKNYFSKMFVLLEKL